MSHHLEVGEEGRRKKRKWREKEREGGERNHTERREKEKRERSCI